MDFTNPISLLLQLKANDDKRIFYCPRAAIKTFGLNLVDNNDLISIDVPHKDLILFLRVVNEGNELIDKISLDDHKSLIR